MKHIPGLIVIPSGQCPFLLEGTDSKSVLSWAEKVRDNAPTGIVYAKSALRYWIRSTYDVNSDDHKEAAAILDVLLEK